MFPLLQLQGYCARFFHDDYFVCRDQFRKIISTLDNPQSSHKIFENLVDAEKYDCDVYFSGRSDAKRVLVMISGTHGIEGYCGSAIQRYILSELIPSFSNDNDLAFLFIHALNPWGMACYRRCDEKGIDVNRNFIDFSQVPDLAEGYSDIKNLLLTSDAKQRQKEINRLVALWGQSRFDELLSGGQYHLSSMPFFGGREKSFARNVIEQVIESFSLEEKELIVLDLHTGLGPWSFGELISDHPVNSNANQYAIKKFGNAVSITEDGASFSVTKQGLLDYAWHPYMQSEGCFLTLEFGTLGTNSLFQTLIEENLLWKSTAEEKSTESFLLRRDMMLKHFFPEDLLWKQAVIFRAEQIFLKSIEYFNE